MSDAQGAPPSRSFALELKSRLTGELAVARAALVDPSIDRAEAIHRIRRALKRVRNLWAVLEPLPGADRDGRMRKVRDTARLLADARDADVMAAEARRLALTAEAGEAVAGAHFVEHCARRADHAHRVATPFDLVDARLRACEADAHSLPDRFAAGALLADGLVETYRRGRREWREIEDGAPVEALHEWRKRVARRRHLSELVPMPTEVTRPSIRDDLGRLGEILGEEHDLAVMRERLETDPGLTPDASERDALLAVIARRRKALKKAAFEMGDELWGLRTRRFAGELEPLRELC